MRHNKADYVKAATAIHVSDEIELDLGVDSAETIAPSDDGAWVRAWMYVSDDEAEAHKAN